MRQRAHAHKVGNVLDHVHEALIKYEEEKLALFAVSPALDLRARKHRQRHQQPQRRLLAHRNRRREHRPARHPHKIPQPHQREQHRPQQRPPRLPLERLRHNPHAPAAPRRARARRDVLQCQRHRRRRRRHPRRQHRQRQRRHGGTVRVGGLVRGPRIRRRAVLELQLLLEERHGFHPPLERLRAQQPERVVKEHAQAVHGLREQAGHVFAEHDGVFRHCVAEYGGLLGLIQCPKSDVISNLFPGLQGRRRENVNNIERAPVDQINHQGQECFRFVADARTQGRMRGAYQNTRQAHYGAQQLVNRETIEGKKVVALDIHFREVTHDCRNVTEHP
mmetsp:Transcript_24759/g.61906  ORF Transcript_24759/g.61906 Transcript_24759/m.61906 type:complete len:334 (-) Transcript_24759:2567-3568(-)